MAQSVLTSCQNCKVSPILVKLKHRQRTLWIEKLIMALDEKSPRNVLLFRSRVCAHHQCDQMTIFGHLKQRKLAYDGINIRQIWFKILPNKISGNRKFVIDFNNLPKWRNFAKSGHTALPQKSLKWVLTDLRNFLFRGSLLGEAVSLKIYSKLPSRSSFARWRTPAAEPDQIFK